ncbi:MAG TPA: universal stress protein, partial [Candidatus Krumholzibacteria bacterium]
LAEETGWRAEPTLRTGLPRQEILSELEKAPADLVILGTHGRSGFERLLMGSVAADVVRQASVSVLVVPPAQARETDAASP